MTRHLAVMTGHPEQLRLLANSLMGGAARLSAVNTVLLRLRAGVVWESDSGRVFEAAVQAPPPIIAAAIERYAGAARAIRGLADELEEAQHEVTGAISSQTEAKRRHDVLMDRRGFAVDPLEQATLEQAMDAEVVVMADAERRHTAAVHRHMAADRTCALQLRALADDVLDDTGGYTSLVNAGHVSKPVAFVGGFLPGQGKLVGVAGAGAGVASRVGLLVFYDEGSWKEIGVNVLASAVTTCGSVLVAGSAIGAKAVTEGGKRVFTKTANPSTGLRLGAGARKTYDDWILASRTKLGLPVTKQMPLVPPRPVFTNATTVDKGRALVLNQVDKAFMNNFELAMANGKGAQAMFVAGITTKHAPAVVKQVNSVQGRLSTAPDKKSEEKTSAPTYP